MEFKNHIIDNMKKSEKQQLLNLIVEKTIVVENVKSNFQLPPFTSFNRQFLCLTFSFLAFFTAEFLTVNLEQCLCQMISKIGFLTFEVLKAQ